MAELLPIGSNYLLTAVSEAIRNRVRLQELCNSCDDLVAMPGWDVLLDLLKHSIEGRSTSVTDACVASGAPATTALRRIGDLERLGLVTRHRDPLDRRRVLLELTQKGVGLVIAGIHCSDYRHDPLS